MNKSSEKRTKLREDYNAAFYVFLIKIARKKITELAQTQPDCFIKEKIQLLKQIGIEQLVHGSCRYDLDRKSPPLILRRAVQIRQREIELYLEKYRTEYEREKTEGKLEGVYAEQLKFEFIGLKNNLNSFCLGRESLPGDAAYAHSRRD